MISALVNIVPMSLYFIFQLWKMNLFKISSALLKSNNLLLFSPKSSKITFKLLFVSARHRDFIASLLFNKDRANIEPNLGSTTI